ncbi:MAG: nuclear transport factor 2 family protein [Pseudolysinimonas sp.]
MNAGAARPRFGGVDHVAVLVADVEDSLPKFRALLGRDPVSDEVLIDPPVRLVHFDCDNVDLQLVQPTGEGGLSRDLARSGEGLHHVCFRVSDIDAARTSIDAAGDIFTGGNGRRACFLGHRPGGLYVELIERAPRAIVALTDALRVSAEYWAAECARDMTAMLAHFTEDAEVETPDGRAVGHEQIAAMYRESFDAYPGLTVDIVNGYAGDNDHGVAFDAVLTDPAGDRWRVRGVNTVELEGGLIRRLRSFEDRPSRVLTG